MCISSPPSTFILHHHSFDIQVVFLILRCVLRLAVCFCLFFTSRAPLRLLSFPKPPESCYCFFRFTLSFTLSPHSPYSSSLPLPFSLRPRKGELQETEWASGLSGPNAFLVYASLLEASQLFLLNPPSPQSFSLSFDALYFRVVIALIKLVIYTILSILHRLILWHFWFSAGPVAISLITWSFPQL